MSRFSRPVVEPTKGKFAEEKQDFYYIVYKEFRHVGHDWTQAKLVKAADRSNPAGNRYFDTSVKSRPFFTKRAATKWGHYQLNKIERKAALWKSSI